MDLTRMTTNNHECPRINDASAAPLFRIFNSQNGGYLKICAYLCSRKNHFKENRIMSERDKLIEQERKGVVELLLKKGGCPRCSCLASDRRSSG